MTETLNENLAAADALAGRRLRATLNLALPLIHSTGGPSLWRSADLKVLYPRYLVAIYPLLRFTCPLFELARDECFEQAADSPFHAVLADYYDRRIPEELGHDEWLLDDLERMGIPRDTVQGRDPLPSMAALVGAQQFYIASGRPVALLGYTAALEGYPPTDALLDQAMADTGYPAAYFRTLRKHAHLDVFHRDELDVFIDGAQPSRADMALVTANALASAQRVVTVMDDLTSQHPSTLLDTEFEAALRAC